MLNMKVKEIKIKLYQLQNILRDVINDQKTQGELKIHSDNKVIDYKTQGEWKIQLTMLINFISSKDSDETRPMHTISDNIEIMMGNETNEITKKKFNSLLQKYQE